ncbi:MAG: hypothetical protein ABIU95_09425, partial [Burkholderiales bacterium]
MRELLDHPAVQGGLAPLIVALVLAALFSRHRVAWLAVTVAYAVSIALSTGFAFSPLTVGRKIILVALAAPILGLIADVLTRKSQALGMTIALILGLAALWVFQTLLMQRPTAQGVGLGLSLVVFVTAIVWLTQRSSGSGLRIGAIGLGLGLGAGVAALMSASIGFFLSGVAIAAGSGAVLLVQVATRREIDAGNTGALAVAVPCAYFMAGSLSLAQLPWYALPVALLVPLAAMLPVGRKWPTIARAALLAIYCVAAGALVIGA